ncbi:MAG: VOC family protein [Arachnia sp.]
MSFTLSPYLALDGTTRQAMEFYQSILGGELTITTFAEGGAGDFPGSDRVMHARLITDAGHEIFGADTLVQMGHSAGDTVALSLMGTDDALPAIFERLAEGGEVIVAFQHQMWGDDYGQLRDKFGVIWHVDRYDARA